MRLRMVGRLGTARSPGGGRSGAARPRADPVGGVRGGSPEGAGHGFAFALMAGVVLVWLAVLSLALRAAALPGEASGTMFVVFPPGISEDEAFASTIGAGGRPVRRAFGNFAWIVHAEEKGFVGQIEANGALAAFRSGPAGIPLAGCFSFVSDDPAPRLVPLPR
jgi:hypothetical protein